ncbi:MAG: TetR/AcrR family transcriptional regulator [Candidatus Nanopelagicales bacterium]
MPEPVKRRPYASPLRAERAAATRTRILGAARTLFLAQGYPATTLTDVATEAGVAADTVLHIFGSKGGLLKAVLDVTIGGDESDVKVLDRPGPQAMRQETDQRRQIAMLAQGMSEQLERVRPLDDILRSAAAVDVDARALRDDLQLRQRREAMRQVVSWIAAHGELRNGISVESAADVVWTVTSPEVHQMLRDQCGWDADAYLVWLRGTLESALLPAPAAPRRRGAGG